ncbi:MAG: FliM/FliN family flagellar motor C-terminal domain-containing protein [Bdellovibrionota bacterium]|nr:FliM/FliN family flagellar motor C-terminal domain-containing protein [Pseudomonadota bacterium]MDY6090508.1 FliM/FliN family flagellar motor C-terminal domain-containing protein [Bdellovibrionota bacterium]
MKAKFDFGHLKLEERDVLKNFLALLFSKEVSFLNESSDFSKEKERVVFKINDCYFSLAFDEKINIQDEINIFNILRVSNKNNIPIKKVPNFINAYPDFEEKFLIGNRAVYFSTINNIQEIGNYFKDAPKNDLSSLKSFDVVLEPTLKVKSYKKLNDMTYNLTLCDQIILKSEALGNLSFNSLFLLNEDNFELTILNINGVDKGENKMECKNINNNDELEVKGEILIGSIDIDVKQLLSLKEGDKIVLDRDDDIKAVLKIGSKEILTGKLAFDEKNVNFIVEDSNF